MKLLEPKEIEIMGKIFVISKFPAMAGREIVTQYFPSAVPKLGNYKENERLALEIMKYVGVKRDNLEPIILNNIALVNAHVYDWAMQIAIEKEMLEYNCQNFPIGRILDSVKDSFQSLKPSIIKTWMDLLQPLLTKEKQA